MIPDFNNFIQFSFLLLFLIIAFLLISLTIAFASLSQIVCRIIHHALHHIRWRGSFKQVSTNHV